MSIPHGSGQLVIDSNVVLAFAVSVNDGIVGMYFGADAEKEAAISITSLAALMSPAERAKVKRMTITMFGYNDAADCIPGRFKLDALSERIAEGASLATVWENTDKFVAELKERTGVDITNPEQVRKRAEEIRAEKKDPLFSMKPGKA